MDMEATWQRYEPPTWQYLHENSDRQKIRTPTRFSNLISLFRNISDLWTWRPPGNAMSLPLGNYFKKTLMVKRLEPQSNLATRYPYLETYRTLWTWGPPGNAMSLPLGSIFEKTLMDKRPEMRPNPALRYLFIERHRIRRF
jgi:hypothetical protein